MNNVEKLLKDYFSNGSHTIREAINELIKNGMSHEEAEREAYRFFNSCNKEDDDEFLSKGI